jgi:hypothetical protein
MSHDFRDAPPNAGVPLLLQNEIHRAPPADGSVNIGP